MKRVYLYIAGVVLLTICTSAQSATYGGGSGTISDPYQIWTAQDMNTIGANSGDWGKCFKLMTDVNMASYIGTQYKIIGDFRGTFDGNGHVIQNLTYSSTTPVTNIGLIGSATNATIENLGLEDVNLSVNGRFVGGLAGQLNNCTVTNCYSAGTITDSYSSNDLYVGGLTGYQNSGTITDCHTAGTIVATMPSTTYYWDTYTGGLVGQQYIGTITHCYSSASVTATSVRDKAYAGGLVGYQPANICNIVNSCSTGPVSAIGSPTVYAGGLVAYRAAMTNSLTDRCYSTGTVNVSSTSFYAYAGGFIGYLSAPITNCYSRGDVNYVGKIPFAGGLIGYATYATITQCYSTGAVTVSGSSYIGGSVGYQDTSSAIGCFWDTNSSGQSVGVGSGALDGINGQTTVEMQTLATFSDSGWDFVNIWRICEGTNYPRLLWSIPAADFVCLDGVDFIDYSFFAERWMNTNCAANNNCDGADFDFSGTVDIADLEIFCNYWLEGIQ